MSQTWDVAREGVIADTARSPERGQGKTSDSFPGRKKHHKPEMGALFERLSNCFRRKRNPERTDQPIPVELASSVEKIICCCCRRRQIGEPRYQPLKLPEIAPSTSKAGNKVHFQGEEAPGPELPSIESVCLQNPETTRLMEGNQQLAEIINELKDRNQRLQKENSRLKRRLKKYVCGP